MSRAFELSQFGPLTALCVMAAELEYGAGLDQATPSDRNSVKLMTVHRAKGLEWDVVFLTGVSDGYLPIVMAEGPEAIEEERRLFYVGVTRAREHLRLSWSLTRNGGGQRGEGEQWPWGKEHKRSG